MGLWIAIQRLDLVQLAKHSRRVRDSYAASKAVALSLVVLFGEASSCDMHPVEDARTSLRLAANEADFARAKGDARKAQSALQNSAKAAIACGCVVPAEDFRNAAAQVASVTQAQTFSDFISALHRTMRVFNDAVTKYRACAARPEI